MSGLSREVLRWLQALDLSYSIKNPKWDFANGFLVAEILSRYFPKDISMHSFTTGTSKETKFNNWGQIITFLKKQSVHIPPSEYEPVIYCAAGAAVQIVTKLYTVLTKRSVKQFTPENVDVPTDPEFMNPTASSLLRDTEIARIPSDHQRAQKASEVVADHATKTQEARAANAPKLFTTKTEQSVLSGGHKKPGHGSLVSLGPGTSVAKVEGGIVPLVVTEVQVKALGGREVSILRQQRHAAGGSGMFGGGLGGGGLESQGESIHQVKPKSTLGEVADLIPTAGSSVGGLNATANSVANSAGFGASMNGPLGGTASGAGAVGVKPVLDIFSAALRPLLLGKATLVQALDPRLAAFSALMEVATSHEAAVADALTALCTRAPLCADSIARSPPEFWKLWRAVAPTVEGVPEHTKVFTAVCRLLKSVGVSLAALDPGLAVQLVGDVIIPQTAALIMSRPGKRDALADMIFGFARPADIGSKLSVLRAAREAIKDTHTFVGVVATFACIELDQIKQAAAQAAGITDASTVEAIELPLTLDERLVDLYQYYGFVGLSAPQAHSRAAALALLNCLAQVDGPHIDALLESADLIAPLAGDSWWEVAAQLLLIASNLLAHASKRMSPKADPEGRARAEEASEVLLGLVASVFSSSPVASNRAVMQVGLCSLAKAVSAFPVLLSFYVPAMLNQPTELRKRLLPPVSALDTNGNPLVEEELSNVGNDGQATISAYTAPKDLNGPYEGPSAAISSDSLMSHTGGKRAYVMGSSSRFYEERAVSGLLPVTQFLAEYGNVLLRHRQLDVEAAQTSAGGKGHFSALSLEPPNLPGGWDKSHLELLATLILPVAMDKSFLMASVNRVNQARAFDSSFVPPANDQGGAETGGVPTYTFADEVSSWASTLDSLKEALGAYLGAPETLLLAKSVLWKFISSPSPELRAACAPAVEGAIWTALKVSLLATSNDNGGLLSPGGQVKYVKAEVLEGIMVEWLDACEGKFFDLPTIIVKALNKLKDTHPKLFSISNLATLLHFLKTTHLKPAH